MSDDASAPERGGELVPTGDLRASHDDRDRVVELLRVAAGDGRLTLEELDERVGAAMTARTHGELAALVSDLPAVPASAEPPKDVVRIVCHGGTARRDGRWMVPRRMEVLVGSGSVTLDFTEAVTSWPSLRIDVEVSGASLTLVTRPGIVVNTDDLEIRGSSVKVHAPRGPDVPVRFRISLAGTASGSSVKVRPPRLPRRTLWQWLRRRPAPYALPPGRG
jgi:hypothetical protein